MRLGHNQLVHVQPVIVLGIGDRRLQRLAHVAGDAPLRQHQRAQRPLDRKPPDHLGHEVQLLRAGFQHARGGDRLVFGGAARVLFLAHLYLRFAFLSAA